MFTSLRQLFSATAKRDCLIEQLNTCAHKDSPGPYEVLDAAAPLISYLSRNAWDDMTGPSLLSAIDTIKTKHGVSEAVATEFQFLARMIDVASGWVAHGRVSAVRRDTIKPGKEGEEFGKTLTALCERFENDLAAHLIQNRGDETHLAFMGSEGCDYSLLASRRDEFADEACRSNVACFANAACNAFLKASEEHFDDMAASNKQITVKFVHKYGDRDQKECASRLAERLLKEVKSPRELSAMLAIATDTTDRARSESLHERLKRAPQDLLRSQP